MSDRTETMQRMCSSFGTSQTSIPQNLMNQNPQLNPNLIRPQFPQFSHPFSGFQAANGGVNGAPPPYPITTPPYSQIPMNHQQNSQNFNHSRSISQPTSVFSLDSLPPLSPSPFQRSLPFPATSMAMNMAARDVSMEVRDSINGLPPLSNSVFSRNAHRRSMSEVTNGLNPMIPQQIPYQRSISGGQFTDWSKAAPLVKKEAEEQKKSEKEAIDELFSTFINLDNIDVLNSSEANDNKNKETLNKKENRVNESGNKKGSLKRRAINNGGDLEAMNTHYRSDSVDNSTTQKLSLSKEFPKPPPSPRSLLRKTSSPMTSIDENSDTSSLKVQKTEFTPLMANEEVTEMELFSPGKASPKTSIGRKRRTVSLNTKKPEFTALEMRKIMANDRLSELLKTDPPLVKRIFDNRRSAARSKEKRTKYMFDLEQKVQTLQKEVTTLSAQCTAMEREMMNLTERNRNLNYRIQSMKKQEQLQEALNDSLAAEVNRLKLVVEGSYNRFGAGNDPNRSQMQSLNPEMLLQELNTGQFRYPQMQFQNQNRPMPQPDLNH